MTRQTAFEKVHIGTEPNITPESSKTDLIQAYNYYQYYYTADDAKDFMLFYLKERKVKRDVLKKAQHLKPIDVVSIGWNCRIISNGGTLPEDIHSSFEKRLNKLIEAVEIKRKRRIQEDLPKISIQERVNNKTSELIGDLEDHLDEFFKERKSDFDANSWFKIQNVKPMIAKRIIEYYLPLYNEIVEAIEGKDQELKEAYSHWGKRELNRYMLFIKNIINAAKVVSRKKTKKKTIRLK